MKNEIQKMFKIVIPLSLIAYILTDGFLMVKTSAQLLSVLYKSILELRIVP